MRDHGEEWIKSYSKNLNLVREWDGWTYHIVVLVFSLLLSFAITAIKMPRRCHQLFRHVCFRRPCAVVKFAIVTREKTRRKSFLFSAPIFERVCLGHNVCSVAAPLQMNRWVIAARPVASKTDILLNARLAVRRSLTVDCTAACSV